ncbi:tetratricopeptide repeat protein [Plectonema radiosum NIES-515]|uniref:Tetratricopeptide repeat protein n=1 Tax=Plectonema radiosum NIES-515 TaxID=2986073 RepID=A0ABT3B3X8_9CYAN|nr:tetratricopeptide repeat protein [Plectonema radiosum]MCV3216074.1 tetratricopeptide repeat protein [Plectonema radiosum NIES-515]
MLKPKIKADKMLIHRYAAAIVGILMLSHPMVAIASQANLIAQQVPKNSPEYAKGKQLLDEAEKLLQQGTGESLQKAIALYSQALLIWRKIGDRIQEFSTLSKIATAYKAFSQSQKALEYDNQALVITRELKSSLLEAQTLVNVAGDYRNLGESQKALQYYNQVLSFYQAEKKLDLAAETLQNIGGVYFFNLSETQKALDAYNQALKIQRTTNNTPAQASTLSEIASVYTSLGEYQKALPILNQALEIQRLRRDINGQSEIYGKIGLLYYLLGENQQSLNSLNQALKLQQQAQFNLSGTPLFLNLLRQAVIIQNIAGTYKSLGDYPKAISYFNSARSLNQKAGNRNSEAFVLKGLSSTYSALGDKQKALESLKQALELQRAIHNPENEASTLADIGDIYQSFGDYQKALDTYNQALTLQRQLQEPYGEAGTLSSIAYVYSLLGDYELSTDTYIQALEICKKIGNRTLEVQTLYSIGAVYRIAEDYPKALEYYNQSLKLSREQKSLLQESTILSGLIRVYESLKDYPKALEFANQILLLSRQQKSSVSEALAYAYMGRVYLTSGDYQKSLDASIKSVSGFEKLGIRQGEANVLGNVGKAYNSLKQPDKAISIYNQQLGLYQKLGDRKGIADTLYNIAVTERDRNNYQGAQKQIESAIAIIEDIRTNVTSQDLRSSYFASIQKYYQFYIDLLMRLHKQHPDKGYDALALQVSERDRARSLVELLNEANADIRQGVDPKLLELERNLQQKLDATEKRQIQLSNKPNTEAQTEALQKEISALLEQNRQVKAQIRSSSPRYAALTQPQSLTLAQQQQLLDNDTLVLEYSLGEERSYLWAVSKTNIKSYELPKRAEIETIAKQFNGLLKRDNYRLDSTISTSVVSTPGSLPDVEVTSKLSQIVLQPVAKELGNKRLVIVSDGALQYLPFGALPNPKDLTPQPPSLRGKGESDSPLRGGKGEQESNSPPLIGEGLGERSLTPLLVEHEIVNLPSVSTLAVLRKEVNNRQPAPKAIAILADPVFSSDDPRLKSPQQKLDKPNVNELDLSRSVRSSGVKFDRLQFTRTEADRISTLFPDALRKEVFDFDASRAIATSPELSQYRIVHFATHGILNSTQPELSGVVLSLFDNKGMPQNGFLRLHDIFNLNLPAELIVLSACETGLGKEIKGEGLIGLTRGFMYAGSPRVVVSLWSVNDEATSELMTKFYQKMLQNKLKPAAALRSAQIEMLKNDKFAAPYYWAAFTLQGEWK